MVQLAHLCGNGTFVTTDIRRVKLSTLFQVHDKALCRQGLGSVCESFYLLSYTSAHMSV